MNVLYVYNILYSPQYDALYDDRDSRQIDLFIRAIILLHLYAYCVGNVNANTKTHVRTHARTHTHIMI